MSETYVHCARCGVAWDFCECWDGPTSDDPEAETPTEPVAVVTPSIRRGEGKRWGGPFTAEDDYGYIPVDKPDVCPACHGSGTTGGVPMCYQCGRMPGERW